MKASKEIKDMMVINLKEKPYFQNTSWDVYKLKTNKRHHSLFFTPSYSTGPTGNGFTAEIGVSESKVVYYTKAYEDVPVTEFSHLGSIHRSIENIIIY